MNAALILAILDFDGNVPEQERTILTEIFTEEVAKHFEGKVYTQKAMREMLLREERRITLESCDDTGCYAEISMALGAERMIEGSVHRLGSALSFRASLIDSSKAEVAARASLEWRGPPGGVPDAARALAQLLMIPEEQRRPGALLLAAETPGATVTIDGRIAGASPVARIEGLSIGVHQVVAEMEGYEPFQADVVILHGADTHVGASLEPEASLVEAWWFWTIIAGAAVAVAGTATGIALGRRSEDEPPPFGSIDVEWRSR